MVECIVNVFEMLVPHVNPDLFDNSLCFVEWVCDRIDGCMHCSLPSFEVKIPHLCMYIPVESMQYVL